MKSLTTSSMPAPSRLLSRRRTLSRDGPTARPLAAGLTTITSRPWPPGTAEVARQGHPHRVLPLSHPEPTDLPIYSSAPIHRNPLLPSYTPPTAFPSVVLSRPPEPASCQGRFPQGGSLRPFACTCATPLFCGFASVWGRLVPTPERPHGAACN